MESWSYTSGWLSWRWSQNWSTPTKLVESLQSSYHTSIYFISCADPIKWPTPRYELNWRGKKNCPLCLQLVLISNIIFTLVYPVWKILYQGFLERITIKIFQANIVVEPKPCLLLDACHDKLNTNMTYA
jgi:hypothetical protein